MSILDHVSVFVTNYARSKAFYEAALAPLGITLLREYGTAGGFGRNGKPEFWIAVGPGSYQTNDQIKVITPIHVGLVARSRAEVNAFYAVAIAAGATDFGAPGPRPMYHPNYYGGFVLDFDGHNIEAVTHAPE